MKQIPKMSGFLRGNSCETCHNIPQKTPMNGFIKKNFLTRQMHLGTPVATSYR